MTSSEKILILEDDDALRSMLADVLEDAGYTALTAECGEKAIDIALCEELILVILDVRMPGINGLDALELMQENLQGASALVITGYVSEADSIRALRLGAADYLKKPFALSDFLNKVAALRQRTLAQRHKMQSENRLRLIARSGLSNIVTCCAQLSSEARQHLLRASLLAQNCGLLMGLGSPISEEIRAATVLLGLRRYLGDDALSEALEFPVSVHQLLGSNGLPTAIAHGALAYSLEEPVPSLPNQELLWNCLAIASRNVDVDSTYSRETSLLDLGTALCQAGDYTNASQAFQRAATSPLASIQLEACLRWAETSRLNQRYYETAELVERAFKLASALGPWHSAQAHLRGAICLMCSGLAGAIAPLEKSRRLLSELQIEPDHSRSVLALDSQKGLEDGEVIEALERWCEPDNLPIQCRDAHWLLPHLLQRATTATNSPLRRTIERLINPSAAYFTAEMRQRWQKELKLSLKVCENSPSYSSAALPTVQVTSLGTSTVAIGAKSISEKDWHTSKTKYLFFYLLCHPQGVSEDALLEEFWPQNWETGKQNLYSATSRLRRIFKNIYGREDDFIQRHSGRLSWNTEIPIWFDLREVRRLAQSVHSGQSAPLWHRLLGMINGTFLAECSLAWAVPIRSELDVLRHDALLALSVHYAERGLAAESLEYAQRLLEDDPLEQRGCELALQANLRLGQNERAIRLYQSFCSHLRREMGAQPTTALMALYHKARLGLHE